MKSRLGQYVHFLLVTVTLTVVLALAPSGAGAAPFAALVMDARSGEVLYSKNADTRLHPASLTKMLTLYIAFEAIERGEISLDTMVKVSKHAASEPPSKLGLKAGQKIQLRYLIRAAAVKSANDCATAIGEAISGSESAFAARMNRTAKALGMKNSTFKNANGLTAPGHLSTARDMTILGRRLFYDFPQYYNIFSRRSTDAGIAEVANTNRRFLDSYKGADGIKTGYTNPAGFNLTASAERGSKRIIATVLGGTSTAQRNAKMAELLDLGFGEAPANVAVAKPGAPDYESVAALPDEGEGTGPAKTIRLVMAVKTSPRPKSRPTGATAPAPELVASMQDSIASALAEVSVDAAAVDAAVIEATAETSAADIVPEGSDAPAVVAVAEPQPDAIVQLAAATTPKPRPAANYADAEQELAPVPAEPEVVTRVSTSGGRHWGINVGRFNSRGAAERALLKTQLTESATLNDSTRKVVQRSGGYDADFVGLSQEQADLACRRLQARAVQCFTMGP